jgi:DNA modification methylase
MHLEIGPHTIHHGDSRDVLAAMPDNSVDAVVCDPPYALVSIVKRFGQPGAAPAKGNDAYARASAGFMGQSWDTGEVAFATEFWAQVLRVLKPGGHVVAFSGTRTYHRLAVAIEDSGFEIRDQLAWVYGSGFPKSHDVSKAIDKAAGAERTEVIGKSSRHGGGIPGNGTSYEISPEVPLLYAPATPQAQQWEGWGTALKPAWEPIVLARKPLIGTVAANVLEHGTGAINIDGCRVEGGDNPVKWEKPRGGIWTTDSEATAQLTVSDKGRFPANILHDGDQFGENGRYFYSPKASKKDRGEGNTHPTVKPTELMAYLCRLVTPPGGVVLDPFMGSGSTGKGAHAEGFRFIGIEREENFFEIAAARLMDQISG